jgi:DNA-binding FadR family transcriptional regulator
LLRIWQDYHLVPFSTRSSKTEEQIQSRMGSRDDNVTELRRIADAMASHDPELAERVTRESIPQVTEAIRAARRGEEREVHGPQAGIP